MKMSKKQFKALIKECLIEILAEGVGGGLVEASRAQRPRPGSVVTEQVRQRSNAQQRSPLLDQAIVESAGGDPVMRDLLNDTAERTLPTFLQDGPPSPVPMPSQSAQVAMDDVFDEDVTSHWANLAFEAKSSHSLVPPPPQSQRIPDHILDQKVGGSSNNSS